MNENDQSVDGPTVFGVFCYLDTAIRSNGPAAPDVPAKTTLLHYLVTRQGTAKPQRIEHNLTG